jgi:PAS domain S-box-containing protein
MMLPSYLRGLPRAALDALDCQIAVVATGGKVVLVNEAWRRSMRSGETSVVRSDVGTNYLQMVQQSAGSSAEQVIEGVRAVLARRINRFSVEYPDQNNSQGRWVQLSVSGCDISGSPHAVIAHRTICSSALKDPYPLAAPERLASMIDAVPHIVWSATSDGRLAYFNAAWSRLIGAGAGVSVEAALLQKMHADDRQRWRERWRHALESGEPYEVEYRLESENHGSARWYLERGTPMRAAGSCELESWLVTATLIDEDKLREEELRDHLHRRDDFFVTLLHELRNPLAPIANAVEILGRSMGDALSVNTARGIIQRQLCQLTRLVDDLLDVSRVAYGNIELRRRAVDLAEIVAIAVEAARPMIQMREHNLVLGAPERPIIVEVDPVRIAQVLTNLVINAAKYTRPCGRISLTTAQEGAVAAIRVSDNGIGISAEKLSEVFELFAQAASIAPAGGTGLGVGLAVAKQLVELHGGSISAASEGIGRGSEFTVRLPLAALPSAGHLSGTSTGGD